VTKLSLAAISVAFILAACGGSSHARSGADAVRKVNVKGRCCRTGTPPASPQREPVPPCRCTASSLSNFQSGASTPTVTSSPTAASSG
jgi:hypothetical protein